MYYIKKRIVIKVKHKLWPKFTNGSWPDEPYHNHVWVITVECKKERLNKGDMIVRFDEIEKIVMKFDNCILNDNEMIGFNPTNENFARFIFGLIPACYKVEIEESPDNTAIYESEG